MGGLCGLGGERQAGAHPPHGHQYHHRYGTTEVKMSRFPENPRGRRLHLLAGRGHQGRAPLHGRVPGRDDLRGEARDGREGGLASPFHCNLNPPPFFGPRGLRARLKITIKTRRQNLRGLRDLRPARERNEVREKGHQVSTAGEQPGCALSLHPKYFLRGPAGFQIARSHGGSPSNRRKLSTHAAPPSSGPFPIRRACPH